MWNHNKALLGMLALANVLMAPGCASVLFKVTQSIPVTSSPPGATVAVNGRQQGVTPLEVRLAREGKVHVIRIESPGYNPFEIQLKRRLSAIPVVGNLLLGGAVGLAAGSLLYLRPDVSSNEASLIWLLGGAAAAAGFILIDTSGGNGYALKPSELTVRLTKSDGTLRVDMIIIDAEDLRNIKWIRVHRD